MPHQVTQLKPHWSSHSFLIKSSSFHVGFGFSLLCSNIWLWYWNDLQGTFLSYIVLKLQRSKEALVCRPDMLTLSPFFSLAHSLSSERVWLRNGQQSFNLLPKPVRHIWNKLGKWSRAVPLWTRSPGLVQMNPLAPHRSPRLSLGQQTGGMLSICLSFVFLRESTLLHEPPHVSQTFFVGNWSYQI